MVDQVYAMQSQESKNQFWIVRFTSLMKLVEVQSASSLIRGGKEGRRLIKLRRFCGMKSTSFVLETEMPYIPPNLSPSATREPAANVIRTLSAEDGRASATHPSSLHRVPLSCVSCKLSYRVTVLKHLAIRPS